ncbi:MAG: SufD family Fe-S cluster assembly protein [Wenzhouxiangellaceae bacterium]|nr:SufD family Fe-S cluster assembly protein [Wenzhouxiangellaceae bacterium]
MSALIDKLVPERPIAPGDDIDGLRRRAQKVLMQHGFPHRKTENWKYTPLALLEKRNFEPVAHAGKAPPPKLPFEACVVAIHNGRIDPARCRLPDGVTITGMVAGDIDVSRLDPDSPAHAFAWLNLARLERGWRLRVERDVARPIVLATSVDDDFRAAVYPRLKVELAANCSATLIEHQHTAGEGLVNAVLDIELASGARLDHVIERRGGDTALVEYTTVRVGEAAAYSAFVLDSGGRLTRQDLDIELARPRAGGRIFGAATLAGHALVDYHTAIEHRVGPTDSREDFRIIADDNATGVFNGRILIVPGADESHSRMNTGNLLLSENARINTKPELEIHAEDVTASHGATIGQLDENARFYMRSRGLSDDEAAALLKIGFAAAVFDEMPAGPVRDWLVGRLEAES